MAEALWQRTPAHILHREEVHGFQKQPVIRSLAASLWQASAETSGVFAQSVSIILGDIADLQSVESTKQTGFVSGTPKPKPESIRPYGLTRQDHCF
jgi:hypothetical protein